MGGNVTLNLVMAYGQRLIKMFVYFYFPFSSYNLHPSIPISIMTSIELRQTTPLAITKITSPSSYASLINTNSLVVVKHPGYPDEFGENCLLELYAWDINSNNRRGLHTGTAATACALVACNSWDGYLSTDREGRAKVDPYATDDVLQPAHITSMSHTMASTQL